MSCYLTVYRYYELLYNGLPVLWAVIQRYTGNMSCYSTVYRYYELLFNGIPVLWAVIQRYTGIMSCYITVYNWKPELHNYIFVSVSGSTFINGFKSTSLLDERLMNLHRGSRQKMIFLVDSPLRVGGVGVRGCPLRKKLLV